MLNNLTEQVTNSAVMRWYSGRESHEQPIIAAIAAVTLLSVLWLGVWKPVSDWRDQAENRFQNAQSLWDWIQANESAARQGAASQSQPGRRNRSLMPLITREANALGLPLDRLQPEADGAVSVDVEAQPFNSMVSWLEALEQKHSVIVLSASMDAEGNPGLINAKLRLQ